MSIDIQTYSNICDGPYIAIKTLNNELVASCHLVRFSSSDKSGDIILKEGYPLQHTDEVFKIIIEGTGIMGTSYQTIQGVTFESDLISSKSIKFSFNNITNWLNKPL